MMSILLLAFLFSRWGPTPSAVAQRVRASQRLKAAHSAERRAVVGSIDSSFDEAWSRTLERLLHTAFELRLVRGAERGDTQAARKRRPADITKRHAGRPKLALLLLDLDQAQ